MSAVIYVDLDAILPVINGVWHRIELTRMPEPGEGLTMLCGVTATAEFDHLDRRRSHGTPTECWNCDLIYRRKHGIPALPSHPGLRVRPQPHPRRLR